MRSLSGFAVIQDRNDHRLHSFACGDTGRRFLLEKVAGPVLVAAALDWHNEIAPINEGTYDDWAWAFRQARMANAYSDHAAGRAIDINATKEGRQGTGPRSWWEKGQRAVKMRTILRRYKVLAWGGADDLGGEYHTPSNWDWMHLYIKPGTTDAQIRKVIADLGIQDDGTRTGKETPVKVKDAPAPEVKPGDIKPEVVALAKVQPGMTGADVRAVQRALNIALGPKIKLDVDGQFGPKTAAAYSAWQLRLGFRGRSADGRPGQESLVRLGRSTGVFTVR